MNLKNKKVLITGATGGIGNSLLQKFIERSQPSICGEAPRVGVINL